MPGATRYTFHARPRTCRRVRPPHPPLHPRRRIETLSGGELEWQDGTLYPVLHRLDNEGLISSTWRIAENGRRRKYYAITPKGSEALEAERRQWLRVDAVLAQLWGLQPRLA